MLSITFQGLCGIARKKGHPGSDVYLPFHTGMPHTAVLMARGADLQPFMGDSVWQPDGVGLDAQDRVVCFWYLHHPAKDGNLTEKHGLRMLVHAQGGTPSSTPPCTIFGGKPAVPLSAQYGPAQAKSTDAKLYGTRICLPSGCFTGLGGDSRFNLVDSTNVKAASGPFAEMQRWQSLFDVEPQYWLISFKTARGLELAIGLKPNAAVSVSNTVPMIADMDVAMHFDGIYEAVRKPSDAAIDPADRFGLTSPIGPLSVDEGVNCIPPSETPSDDDPIPNPPAPAVIRSLTRRVRPTSIRKMGARKK